MGWLVSKAVRSAEQLAAWAHFSSLCVGFIEQMVWQPLASSAAETPHIEAFAEQTLEQDSFGASVVASAPEPFDPAELGVHA
jgi:hypothetical protein